MNANSKSEKISYISETLLIAFLTITGYAVTLIYEYAYSSYFGIPYFFISLELVNIFWAIFVIVGFIFVSKGASTFFETVGLFKDSAIGRFRARNLFIILFASPYIIILHNSKAKEAIIFFLIIVLLPIATEIISTLVYGKKIAGWKNKREKLESVWSKNPGDKEEPSVTDKFFGRIFFIQKEIPVNYFLSVILFCCIAYSMGAANASMQKSFYTFSNDPSRVLIRQYKDSLYSVSINRETNVFNADILLVNKNDLFSLNTHLILEKIGKLHQPEILKSSD